jgi:hypothetical protein
MFSADDVSLDGVTRRQEEASEDQGSGVNRAAAVILTKRRGPAGSGVGQRNGKLGHDSLRRRPKVPTLVGYRRPRCYDKWHGFVRDAKQAASQAANRVRSQRSALWRLYYPQVRQRRKETYPQDDAPCGWAFALALISQV